MVTGAESRTTAGGGNQRGHIVATALALMAQRGVDGTSMRDLAQAAGLNVASLYHYFPSKRDLLVAVLADRGLLEGIAEVPVPTAGAGTLEGFAGLIAEILESMLEVEDFIRLMIGEALRNDETALAVGRELLAHTQDALARRITEEYPVLGNRANELARLLRAALVGIFFEYVAGVLDDPTEALGALRARGEETAAVLWR